MKLAVLTCGMLPIPAVQGGAVENLIDFYLEYNNNHHLHDITIYSPWDDKLVGHPALASDVNHYHYIDVSSLRARLERRLFKFFRYTSKDYFNYFIEYYFEKAYADIKNRHYDYIILENSDGHAYKLSQRGYRNIIIHMNNEARKSRAQYHREFQNNISLILTCSDFIRDSISNFMPACKTKTLYNAIDTKKFFPKENPSLKREIIGLKNNDFVIVYSGRINEEKGISELIDAMLQLKDYPNIKLMIIGGTFYGNAKNENEFVRSLKNKAKSIEDKIVFTGFIPYKNVPDYLHLADIAALPSMWDEPFGLTIVEALAAGLPLITARSGGIPEICEGVATIVNRDNIVNNLTSAIIDLYNHPEKRIQMAVASIDRAKHFDKEVYAEKFFAAIKDLS
ncbi:glycosyl transferase [Xylanibacter ruminicola]|uniref:Hexosyltransferase YtcC n=2 Tax=Xylanibacter ruminicola TaxID=839 RepID=D5ESU8_XYLR2|nr:glycosyltransferase family 4 protein [Xylanibacter ruminicola]ADE82505.1 putative hexosyltransferase YtcC [Xylanibacter ruminicola 23]GJG33822.1 glycosyl transferase [Xylanibacter ruminicola]SEH67366.1 Glycosyltransferase involved in cell wall bisynthesis [Xylanibacter ruminicola]